MSTIRLHKLILALSFFQENIDASLQIIHDVASSSLGSLCVTERFRSLSVPLDMTRFESARQKADLASTLLQDLGVARHNGKNILRTHIFPFFVAICEKLRLLCFKTDKRFENGKHRWIRREKYSHHRQLT